MSDLSFPRVVPREPRAITSLDGLAPRFKAVVPFIVYDMAELGWPCVVRESLRTDDRQLWLFGFGRVYDDGRGIVTGVQSAWTGWHFYGLAVDLVYLHSPDNAPSAFYFALERVAEKYGCRTGLRWTNIPGGDGKHVQPAQLRSSPSWRARALYIAGGKVAVWKAVGAN